MNKVFKAIGIAIIGAYMLIMSLLNLGSSIGAEKLGFLLCIMGIFVCIYFLWQAYKRTEAIKKSFSGERIVQKSINLSEKFDWLYQTAPLSWAALPTLIIGRANFIWGELVMVYSYIALFFWAMFFAFSMI